MNKKFFIALLVIIMAGFTPELMPQADAQIRKRDRIERRKDRRQVRRVTRRVVRRVSRRAHLLYRGLPAYGVAVRCIPQRVVVVSKRPFLLHYHQGIYYREEKPETYIVVVPEPGVRVSSLPGDAITVQVDNSEYQYYFGTFYVLKKDEYEVVDPPEGAVVNALPDGYEVKEVDGREFYVLHGTYFQEVETNEFDEGLGYEVVSM
ncbi:MAG: DUF6515 family protein [Cyclobacteriaceae bacterium]